MTTPFTVMTFNIRGSYFEIDGDNYWPHRADLNVRTIKRHDPDLIGFQEYQLGNQTTYDSALPAYDYEMGPVTVDDSPYGMYNAIYWKRDRFQKVDGGGFYLSHTPDTYSWGWDAMLVRAATWLKLDDKLTGQRLFHLNTHLDHLGEAARVEGARMVAEHVDTLRDGLPALLTADFNSRAWGIEQNGGTLPDDMLDEATPPGSVHRVLTGVGFHDVYLSAGQAEGPDTNTFHGFMGQAAYKIGQRIDWIMTLDGAARFQVDACTIVRDGEPPVYPSDHYPVVARLLLV